MILTLLTPSWLVNLVEKIEPTTIHMLSMPFIQCDTFIYLVFYIKLLLIKYLGANLLKLIFFFKH